MQKSVQIKANRPPCQKMLNKIKKKPVNPPRAPQFDSHHWLFLYEEKHQCMVRFPPISE